MTRPDPGSVFISYSRKDKTFALKLAKDLRAAGAKIWMDTLDLVSGQEWDDEVERALEACSKLLVVLSPASVESGNVKDELAVAREEQKQIIPVLYRECKVPLRIRRLHRCDVSSEYKAGFAEILKALGIEAASHKAASASRSGLLRVPTRRSKRPKKADLDPGPLKLRRDPIQLSEKAAETMVRQYAFFDAGMNKSAKGIVHEFQRKGELVYDHSTDLVWQQSGSYDKVAHAYAEAYVESLNRDRSGGYSDWRMPTLEEAMSLMAPEQLNSDLYIHSVFDKKQTSIYTCDARTAKEFWVVYFNGGFCSAFLSFANFVRAVRSR